MPVCRITQIRYLSVNSILRLKIIFSTDIVVKKNETAAVRKNRNGKHRLEA